eukprot:TRINITY_DN93303_c0_g1_i1.p1 TRINITY_DN93303_c0_g1~~TRINITY_DN93303_c0_g1_i1.p1  ORF type:complete len:297 (-),score=47.33 TRINITY_DN93303_c0_g1_i1:34-924(-)
MALPQEPFSRLQQILKQRSAALDALVEERKQLRTALGGLRVAAKGALSAAGDARRGVVKHIYFDFDQTISQIHVFKQLAGWEPGVTAPFASSERGQIHRLQMLNKAGEYVYSASTGNVVPCASGTAGGGSWTAGALGGRVRVERLKTFFADLKAAGTRLTVITKGNVGACRYLLEHEGLLHFFERVYGMIGKFYDETPFDTKHQTPSLYEAEPQDELCESKASLIHRLMASEGLAANEAALVEDDPNEISSVSGICRSVFVKERKGMTSRELEDLNSMTGSGQQSQGAQSGYPQHK